MREHTQARSKADGACLQSWHGPVYHQIRCAACRPTVRAPAFPALRKEVARRRGASPVAPCNRTDGCPSKNYRRIMRAANPGSGQRRHTHTHTLTRRCRPDPPSELAGSLRMRGRLTGLITERGGVNLVISTHIVVQTKRFRKSLPVAEHFRGNQSKWMAVCDSGCCPQESRLVCRTRVVMPARLPMQRKSETVPCRSRIIVHLG